MDQTNKAHDYAHLFQLLYEPLYSYAFTIVKDSDDAKDVVQTAFLNFIEKSDNIAIHTNARSYLYKMIHNEGINFIRKKALISRHHDLAGKESDIILPGISQEEEKQIIEQRINNVLDKMPARCRAIFIKSRSEQKKYAEIATEFNISVKTVEAHMSKALKIVRDAVGVLGTTVCLYIITLSKDGVDGF